MLRNIIWDVDGTLFDTYPAMAGALQTALLDFGVDAPVDWLESLARRSMDHCIASLAQTYALGEADILRTFLEQYGRRSLIEQPPFPGVRAVCEQICAAGGKNVIVTHRRRAGTEGLLAAHDMRDYIAGSITGDDGYPRKPHPAAFEAALETYDLPPAETLTVGDRDIDILAGQAAGLFACLFGPPVDGIAPDLVIGDFSELLMYLARL
jgi:HAD superfamily hydrolase (TIGR01509 family)